MLFRALFWIGLVWLLMPHEPDLGLGRPAPLAGFATAWAASGLARAGFCREAECGLSQGRSLATVKAEIEQSLRARHEL